jgi:hypothetical protein
VELCTYILPIRRSKFCESEAEQFAAYFETLSAAGCEILVVDGSPPEVFGRHEKIWSSVCRHELVDPRFKFLNDKVNGVHTGVALASHEKIILADDDIRYRKIDIEQMCALLDEFEVVRPQNFLSTKREFIKLKNSRNPHLHPLPGQGEDVAQRQVRVVPLWAKLEQARMLINRATLKTADYPGTCAFLRKTFLRAGEYDGDVLFDNEELIRHLARSGARIAYENNFFIAKRPPTFKKWLEQRPRQAYEDFGLRLKTILFAALLPVSIGIAMVDPRWLSIFLLSILIAFAGWLRGAARKYFPLHACLFAPLWIFERTLSTYWAFYWFVTRGGYPFGKRLLTRGIGRDWFEGGRIAAKMASRH